MRAGSSPARSINLRLNWLILPDPLLLVFSKCQEKKSNLKPAFGVQQYNATYML